jgi:hypothetical protein
VERKINELTYLLENAANRAIGKLIVGILPPPDEVGQNPGLMAFRNKMCDGLKESLSEHSSICVRAIPKQLVPDSPIQGESEPEDDSRIVYRIPIHTPGMRGDK